MRDFEDLIKLSKDEPLQSISEIVEKKLTSIAGFSTLFWENLNVNGLARARKHNHLECSLRNDVLHQFVNECEFWHADPTKVNLPIGRCNDAGESMFYCSNHIPTAIVEVRPKLDDFITLINFARNTTDGLRINPVGLQYLAKMENFKNDFENFLSERNKEFLEMDDFLNSLFHNQVNEGEEHLYKLSVAVTRCMMKNVMRGEAIQSMHGMMYPSIATDKTSFNLVLRGAVAMSHFRIYALQTLKVVAVDEESLTLKLVRNGGVRGNKTRPFDMLEVGWSEIIEDGKEMTIRK